MSTYARVHAIERDINLIVILCRERCLLADLVHSARVQGSSQFLNHVVIYAAACINVEGSESKYESFKIFQTSTLYFIIQPGIVLHISLIICYAWYMVIMTKLTFLLLYL